MLKRILALLLCSTVLNVFVGCSDTPSPSPETSIIDVSSNVEDEYVNPKDHLLCGSESFDFDYDYYINNEPNYINNPVDTPTVGHISYEEEAIEAAYEVWERFYDQEMTSPKRECTVHYDFRSDIWYIHEKWPDYDNRPSNVIYLPIILNVFIKSDGTVMGVWKES